MGALEQDTAAERLMGVEVVAQIGDVVIQGRQIPRGLLVQPAFGGGGFAVLLVVTVLGNDELRAQGDGVLLSRRHDHRGDGAVIVGDRAAFVFDRGALAALDVLGGKVPRAVQGDGRAAPERLETGQRAGFTQALESDGSALVLLYTPMRTYSMGESVPPEIILGYILEYRELVLDERISEAYPGQDVSEIRNPVVVGSLSVVEGQVVQNSPSEITAQMMTQAIMIPMVLMILLIMAAQLAATSVAMEKEEKTIETLLTMPVPRGTILVGKIGGVVVVSAIAVTAYMFGFSYYMSGLNAMSSEGNALDLAAIGLAPTLGGMALLFVTLFISLVSALSLAVLVASFTEDVRSAQSLMGILYVPIFIPSLVLMFVDISQLPGLAQGAILAIPFTYPILAAKAMYTGEYVIVLLGIVYQLVFTSIVIYAASRLFSSEKILTARFRLRKGGRLQTRKAKT